MIVTVLQVVLTTIPAIPPDSEQIIPLGISCGQHALAVVCTRHRPGAKSLMRAARCGPQTHDFRGNFLLTSLMVALTKYKTCECRPPHCQVPGLGQPLQPLPR